MADSTTVRVRTSTRDELKALSAELSEPVDVVIREGITLVRREQWRRRAEADARAAAADLEDRREIASALADLTG